MNPKISILIPMYNRKHYIANCIDSVLIQTFQDFEIIVRDDGSTDGSADFVEEKYSSEISSGKLKLKRNEKNLGENSTVKRLFLDASGKYFAVLHSDDMYLTHALQHLYETAENFNADVVHTIRFLKSPPGGIINSSTQMRMIAPEKIFVDEVTLMPSDQYSRFVEFYESSDYFGDIQYSFFRREFIMDNKILLDTRCNPLYWLLLAKVYVKTPKIYYIYRDAPDSTTRSNADNRKDMYSTKKLEQDLITLIEDGIIFDKIADDFEVFRNHPEFKSLVHVRCFNVMTLVYIKGRNYYHDDGRISPDVQETVEKVFKKYYGIGAAYPIFLFHLVNVLPYIRNFERAFAPLELLK